MNRGFTLIEMLVTVVIILIIISTVIFVFVKFNKKQALDKDTETIVETLRTAQNQTISSNNANQYGVHFASSTITLFSGSSYSSNGSGNLPFTLKTSDLIMGLSLAGSGTDVIFNRLTGETAEYGTVTVSSAAAGYSRTVTIYKTGVVDAPGL